MLKLNEFRLREKDIDCLNVDIEPDGEMYLIPLLSPWSTYVRLTSYSAVSDVCLSISLDFSKIYVLVTYGNDIHVIDKHLTEQEEQMLRSIVEKFV